MNLISFRFQILSYLRAGSRNKKKKKEKLGNLAASHGDNDGKQASTSEQKIDDIPLYDDDVGDYVPTLKRDEKRRGDDRRHRDRERDRDRERTRDRRDEDRSRRNYFDKDAREAEEEHQKGFSNQDKEM